MKLVKDSTMSWLRLNRVNGFGDPIYAIVAYALVVFGAAVQLSVTFHTDEYAAIKSHLLYILIGTAALIFFSLISYQALNVSLAVEMATAAVTFVLLVVCAVIGKRAIKIGVFIQPSEIAKFDIILSATFCFGQRARDLCRMLEQKAKRRRYFKWFHPTEKGLQFFFVVKAVVFAVLTAAESHLSGFLIIAFITYAILVFMKYVVHIPHLKKMRVKTDRFTPDGKRIHEIRYVVRYWRWKSGLKVITIAAIAALALILLYFYSATRYVKADRAAWEAEKTAYSAMSEDERKGVERPRSADEQNLHEKELYAEKLRLIPSVVSDYQKARIYSWMDRGLAANDIRLQQTQTIYAIASGGLAGKGYLNSLQKYSWVTQAENDMIFSIICEELGIWGPAILMALYVLLTWRGMRIAAYFKSRNTCIIPFAVTFHIALQAILNIAVCLEFIPNTGVSLPFISQGGSSIIMLLSEVGMVLSVSSDAKLDRLGRPLRRRARPAPVTQATATEDSAS